ncbi:MAG TPA: ABC transporter ATP-binding protein [Telluria sp.]
MIATAKLGLDAGGRTLVDALDWQAGPGECWAIIGRNGAGKSTLLRTLAGLRTPERGGVLVRGRPLAEWQLSALARERAYLAQSRSDPFAYRVIETVLMARHPWQAEGYWEDSDDHRAAREALRALDVLPLEARDVRTLSGGERQRVAIAALLAQDTPLMLLDEPASALDLAHQVSVMRLMAGLCRDRGRTVVMVSHDLNMIRGAATHALLLHGDGRWSAGRADEVMRAPLLSDCLGHPVEALAHRGRTVFINLEE